MKDMHNFFSYPCTQSFQMYNPYNLCPYTYMPNMMMYNPDFWNQLSHNYSFSHYKGEYNYYIELKDYGSNPFVVNIEKAANQNKNFRTALWTGKYLQLTLMSINAGDDIGLEVHTDHDQFIRIEEGEGIVKMGDCKDKLDFQKKVSDGYVILIPAGKWHNLINTGKKPLKLYSIYAPPEHPYGTVQKNKKALETTEKKHC
ncbi:MAG TPA: cupin domain-containing protein [Ruminiclostridium sp.]|uniref:Cupin n=2 Tax=Acetivibrio saccincola TaxID=1677857 RepID=A0A2S8R9A2_9FIRM|nr:cupin domain-containing protein [Acetivibrio saccincola]NLW27404.1 cupin domain-containing protein [Acetivibrio saccincola]PQQ66387.1 cupin [Acetivibrio saccincola]HAA42976.1 cupin domain-containing protein [Ruminiclostridium sp.]